MELYANSNFLKDGSPFGDRLLRSLGPALAGPSSQGGRQGAGGRIGSNGLLSEGIVSTWGTGAGGYEDSMV